jgi:Rrf2 family protein
MIHLCRQGRGSLASRQAIADQAGIPAHFLAKIAQDLAKAGFIEIRQGAKGGFILTRAPSTITLLEVVETMIGEIHLNDCIARPAGCQHSYHCAVHRVWLDARDQLRETLRRVSFDQLLNDTSCLPAYGDDLMEAECLDSPAPLQGELQ